MALTQVSTNGVKDGSLLNADINASAAIASSKLAKPIDLGDNEKIRLGTGNDLEIFHNGTSNIIEATNGDLNIRMNNSENAIVARQNGAAELYHDNGRKLQTKSTGINVYGAGSTFLELGSEAGGTDTVFIDTTHGSNSKPNMDFRLDGDLAMRIDSSGNVGIGTTSPDTPLTISRATTGNVLKGLSTNNNTRAQLQLTGKDSSGNAVTTKLGGDGDFGGMLFTLTNHKLGFATNNAAPQMVLDTSGRLGIGTSGPNKRLEIKEAINSAAVLRVNRSTDVDSNPRDFIEFMRGSNQVGFITATNSSVSYLTSSDYRLKENATAISDGITRLKTLKPYRFNFKAAPDKTIDGFFAHEVTAVPEAISGQKDAVEEDGSIKPQGIDQSKLVPLLVAAVQELITKVETLEAA